MASGDITQLKAERPVILCFGGQVSTHVGLDHKLYNSVPIFRKHLDEVDSAVKSLGEGSICPGIFSRKPFADTVKLQTALFALQYACAKTWESCGLQGRIVSVVGHSFGEITATCIAGALSLHDTVKLIVGRARVIRDSWGPDSGAMMAVEADEATVHKIVEKANTASGADGTVGIACYNGLRSFTLAGSSAALSVAQQMMAEHFTQVKMKRLNVTNAFHSKLVEKLETELRHVGTGLQFQKSRLPIERASTEAGPDKLDETFVFEHMRKPVFFRHAIQRLSKKFPQAIFLEAGSNSTITTMAARALAQTLQGQHFQGLSITNSETGLDGLTSTTLSLWRGSAGLLLASS